MTNKTVHQCILMTGMCSAPHNDECNNNFKKKKDPYGSFGVICFSVKWMLIVDLQSTS